MDSAGKCYFKRVKLTHFPIFFHSKIIVFVFKEAVKMSKFNSNIIRNNENHKAFKMDPKEKLISEVLTSFFNENKFYGDNSKTIVSDIRNMIKIDSEFVANLTIYVRKEMNMRSISHVHLGELAHDAQGKKYVREILRNIVLRVDDMSEILSYYLTVYGKPIPNSLKKGISECFLKFDEFSLAKYNRNGQVILKDILNLVHPKPADELQSGMFKRILEDNLQVPFTWETMLSKEGNNKNTWEKLIQSGKLGYMAALRNLRNIIKAEPDNINDIYDMIRNKERVIKSRQLPFRYYSAFKILADEGIGTSKVYDVLEEAIKYSTENIQKLPGKTFMSTDVSGSMGSAVSRNSSISCAEIGALLMSIANSICDEAIISTFDSSFKIVPSGSQNGIIASARSITPTWGWTDLSLPIKYLINNKIYVDRIILFSDNEINLGYDDVCQKLIDKYRKKINPDVYVHAVDLLGYGTQQFKGPKVNIIAGWSEKILEFISKVENGLDNMKLEIERYHFKNEESMVI